MEGGEEQNYSMYAKSFPAGERPVSPETHMTSSVHGTDSGPIPPPATYKNPEYRGGRPRNWCPCALLCCCLTLVIVIVILGISALIVWIVLRPQATQYSLKSVEMTSLNLTTVDTGFNLDSDITCTFLATNPNDKVGFKYEQIGVQTTYGGEILGNVSIAPFYQGHDNVTTLISEMRIVNYQLTGGLGTALQEDIKSNNVPLQVLMDIKTRVIVGSYRSLIMYAHMSCDLNLRPPTSKQRSSVLNHITCFVKRD